MIKAITTSLLLLTVCGPWSCADDDDPAQFVYPLNLGSEWFYTRDVYSVNDSGDLVSFDGRFSRKTWRW
jgi:hypothetical protein